MNESVLILADFTPKGLLEFQHIDLQSFDLVNLFRKSISSKQQANYLLVTAQPKKTLRMIRKQVKVIGAAGGLVKNGDGKLLFIHRLGKWDLPKGKIDPGERPKKTAVREVTEECGIKIDYLGPKISSSYHMYEMKGALVLKKTNWYEMAVNKSPQLIPQTSEDITDAIWLDPIHLDQVLANTYGIIKDVLEKRAYI